MVQGTLCVTLLLLHPGEGRHAFGLPALCQCGFPSDGRFLNHTVTWVATVRAKAPTSRAGGGGGGGLHLGHLGRFGGGGRSFALSGGGLTLLLYHHHFLPTLCGPRRLGVVLLRPQCRGIAEALGGGGGRNPPPGGCPTPVAACATPPAPCIPRCLLTQIRAGGGKSLALRGSRTCRRGRGTRRASPPLEPLANWPKSATHPPTQT